jgi:PKD repeat protein
VNVSCTLEANASDDDGSIVNYTWDFGDGNPPESTPATTIDHTFTSISQPMVTLTVTDNNGATNSVTQPINVSETGGLRLK